MRAVFSGPFNLQTLGPGAGAELRRDIFEIFKRYSDLQGLDCCIYGRGREFNLVDGNETNLKNRKRRWDLEEISE
jgi:hypothetical protein